MVTAEQGNFDFTRFELAQLVSAYSLRCSNSGEWSMRFRLEMERIFKSVLEVLFVVKAFYLKICTGL